jgi:hypothetical protein
VEAGSPGWGLRGLRLVSAMCTTQKEAQFAARTVALMWHILAM